MRRKIFFIALTLSIAIANLYDPLLAIGDVKSCNGNIVYEISETKKNIYQIYLYDLKNRKKIKLTRQGRNEQPRWSPNGKSIAFMSVRDNHKNAEIYIMDGDGQNQRRLTFTPGGNSTKPKWNSAGTKIFYRSTVMGNIQENVIDLTTLEKRILGSTGKLPEVRTINNIEDYIKEISKKDKKEIEKDLAKIENDTKKLQETIQQIRNRFEYLPSPDGAHYVVYFNQKRQAILLNTKTAKRVDLKSSKSGSSRPAFSKDGSKIAYVNPIDLDYFLIIYDIPDGKYTEINLPKKKDEACGGGLSWSPDDKSIAYTCSVDYIFDYSFVRILNLETKQSVELLKGSSPDWH